MGIVVRQAEVAVARTQQAIPEVIERLTAGHRVRVAVGRSIADLEMVAAAQGRHLGLGIASYVGLPVSYRSVLVDDLYTRQGDLYMASGHVNLVLDRLPRRTQFAVHPATVVPA